MNVTVDFKTIPGKEYGGFIKRNQRIWLRIYLEQLFHIPSVVVAENARDIVHV